MIQIYSGLRAGRRFDETLAVSLGWDRGLVRQGRDTGVPVFVKQLGEFAASAADFNDPKGANPAEWPEELRVREFPEVLR